MQWKSLFLLTLWTLMMRSDSFTILNWETEAAEGLLFLPRIPASFSYVLSLKKKKKHNQTPKTIISLYSVTEYKKILLFFQSVQSVCVWWGQVGAVLWPDSLFGLIHFFLLWIWLGKNNLFFTYMQNIFGWERESPYSDGVQETTTQNLQWGQIKLTTVKQSLFSEF